MYEYLAYSIGPLHLASCDHIFPRYYGLEELWKNNIIGLKNYYGLEECQKWKECVENSKMAKFEAPGIKE